MAEFFGVGDPPYAEPRYNIAPSQAVPMLRYSAEGGHEWFSARWGLVPASGYFEWKQIPGSKVKQPFYIHPAGDTPFCAFAGLWERWGSGETLVESCTIIVTAANDRTRTIHGRRPVILASADYEAWLGMSPGTAEDLLGLLRPCPPEWVAAYRVNNPRNDEAAIVQPLPESLFSIEEA